MILHPEDWKELVTAALSSSSPMTESACIYFLRVFYLRDSIFMLSPRTVEMVGRAAGCDSVPVRGMALWRLWRG